MYLTGENALFISLFLCANLSACQSMVSHEYSAKDEPDASLTFRSLPNASSVPDFTKKTMELLKEEPIASMDSSDSLPMLTPASFYHSPDPPAVTPEYIPSLFFDFDSWTLTNKGKHMLELTAMQLQKDQKSKLIIEGHCDDRGAEGYNLVLGDKRALAMQDYLVSLGIAKSRLTAVSFGDTHPVCFEDHETCHALNRRGYLVSYTDSLPSGSR